MSSVNKNIVSPYKIIFLSFISLIIVSFHTQTAEESKKNIKRWKETCVKSLRFFDIYLNIRYY